MRYPIRVQLLVPTFSIVVLAIALATVTSVHFSVSGASRRQADQLGRVVATITEGGFPPTARVLQQMRGLSGGEFVLLDENGQAVHNTIALSDDEQSLLRAIEPQEPLDSFTSASVVRLSHGDYYAEALPVQQQWEAAQGRSLLALYPKNRWSSTAREVATPILASGAIAMVVGGLVMAVFAGRFARPIRLIGRQAMSVASGRFDAVTVPPRDDEIAELARSINAMTEKLSHYEDEVRRNERMRTLGQLGAGMAHQLRNSATGARIAIELHGRECPAANESESTQVAMRELRLMESYLQRFMDLGQSRQSAHELVELQSVIEDVLDLIRPTCLHAGIDLAVRASAAPIRVDGDTEALRQLLINLALNAVDAASRHAPTDARVVVELERTEQGNAELRVWDSGPGPAVETRDRVFEPFVTEKPDGTGLGLYVARQVAEAHGGSIRWQRVDEMTCFIVEIPLASE